MQENQPTTADAAVNFWAARAIQFDQLITDLADLLPDIDADGSVPLSDSSLQEIEQSLANARLAADTIVGAYTRHAHREKAAAQQQNGQQAYSARW